MKTKFGSTLQGRIYIGLSVVLLVGGLVAAAHARRQGPAPVYTTGTDVSDPNQVGNIDAAVTQTQQLLTALAAVNYVPENLPNLDLITLPDAVNAETASERSTDTSSYIFPDPTMMPEQSSQIAAYTDIYARLNRSYFTGDTASSAPTGYFIVAWKNGTVQKVAVSDVRMMPTADGNTCECFPGMTGYDSSLPVWGQ